MINIILILPALLQPGQAGCLVPALKTYTIRLQVIRPLAQAPAKLKGVFDIK